MGWPLRQTLAQIQRGIEEGLQLGAQLYVSLGGDVLANEALGEVRPGIPMQVDTSLFWFSCTKPITAVAVAQLLERGLLDLHEPVRQVIPEFGSAGKEGVTLWHLLTHTGGFRTANPTDLSLSWERTIADICASPLEPGWVPGRKAGYHHTASWYILGELVQRRTQRRFADYVREEILLPLGMNQSWMAIPPDELAALGDRAGEFFEMRPGEPTRTPISPREPDLTACRPGSSARGPVRELGIFLEMLRNGGLAKSGKILRPETIELMRYRHRQGLYDETFQQYIDWGLGFLLNTRHPGQSVLSYGYGEHASEQTFGHGGMQTSVAFVDPKNELVVAWICNGMCGERLHRQRNHAINTAIYEDLGLDAGRP